MATVIRTTVRCPKCGAGSEFEFYQSINAAENPELKEAVLSGDIFVHECPHCGAKQIVRYNLLYHDPDAKVIVCLSDTVFHSDGMEGYTCRLVSDAGSFIEKVKIFDAGLDDLAVEMCKYVTKGELEKDVDLKFFNFEGADNEITLTYPENGQMQMIRIGFNVYEDCAGIINRNPALREGASGMVRLDQEWLGAYFK